MQPMNAGQVAKELVRSFPRNQVSTMALLDKKIGQISGQKFTLDTLLQDEEARNIIGNSNLNMFLGEKRVVLKEPGQQEQKVGRVAQSNLPPPKPSATPATAAGAAAAKGPVPAPAAAAVKSQAVKGDPKTVAQKIYDKRIQISQEAAKLADGDVKKFDELFRTKVEQELKRDGSTLDEISQDRDARKIFEKSSVLSPLLKPIKESPKPIDDPRGSPGAARAPAPTATSAAAAAAAAANPFTPQARASANKPQVEAQAPSPAGPQRATGKEKGKKSVHFPSDKKQLEKVTTYEVSVEGGMKKYREGKGRKTGDETEIDKLSKIPQQNSKELVNAFGKILTSRMNFSVDLFRQEDKTVDMQLGAKITALHQMRSDEINQKFEALLAEQKEAVKAKRVTPEEAYKILAKQLSEFEMKKVELGLTDEEKQLFAVENYIKNIAVSVLESDKFKEAVVRYFNAP
jgi:hypothetical protein